MWCYRFPALDESSELERSIFQELKFLRGKATSHLLMNR